MILPNGQRAGFFIGDAAGVGKGRQVGYCNKINGIQSIVKKIMLMAYFAMTLL